MQTFRSLVFNITFYLNLVIWMILVLPTLILPRGALLAVIKAWARSNLWLLKVCAGIDYKITGQENIPAGACLVASKHQSLWETFALFCVFDDPCFILKRELMWIPFFGWYSWKGRMIAVDRGARSVALRKMREAAKREVASGRQILIFPEGTRRPPNAEPAYKYGVTSLYSELDVACVPIGLNSGVFWPRRQFSKKPGTIRVEICPAIPPGLDKGAFALRLQSDIETASNRLLQEASST